MPSRYRPEIRRQVIQLARAGTRVAQLATMFGMSEATIYNWPGRIELFHNTRRGHRLTQDWRGPRDRGPYGLVGPSAPRHAQLK
jgi:hypothetical protein